MLATIAYCDKPWLAHIVRGRLEAEGLLALVSHEHHLGMNRALATALGGAKVQAPYCEQDAALEIVKS
jgi:hypothetical protein